MNSKKKLISILKSIYGKPIKRHRNYDLVSSYHKIISENTINETLDERTAEDLNIKSFFDVFDRTITPAGQQYLYHLLHNYNSEKLIGKERNQFVSKIMDDEKLRIALQSRLKKADKFSVNYVNSLLLKESFPFYKNFKLFYLLSALSVASAIFITFNNVFFFLFLAVMFVNIIITRYLSNKISQYFTGFAGLGYLLSSAYSLAGMEKGTDNNLDEVINQKEFIARLRNKISFLLIDKDSLSDLAFIVIEYLNMVLLFEVITYYRAVNQIKKHQEKLHRIFKNIGEIDIACSLASYFKEYRNICSPEFKQDKVIFFDNLYHPLIENPVSNSLDTFKKSMLITGSNMSGKTTFIKTIALNIILARNFNFAHANKFVITDFIIKSAIRREDSLTDGKSYFFSEIEQIKEFLELSESGSNYFFIIDEIFRGTNTAERVGASSGVLEYLAKNNIVFVTTHDIELTEYLKEIYEMYHFSEQVTDNEYYFDYKLKKGDCKSGNAIRLLEIMEYPEEITTSARNIAEQHIYYK